MKTCRQPSVRPKATFLSPRERAPKQSHIEFLETRIAPAFTSTVAGATASFQGDGGSDSLVITETGAFLSHNRFAAGDAAFASALDFDSTLAGDQMLAVGAASIINVNGGGGTDTFGETRSTDFTVGALMLGGSITLAHSSGAHVISVPSAIAGNEITITSDQMSLAAPINAAIGIVTLRPLTPGTRIDLGGADFINTLGLTTAELNFVTAGTIRIGSSMSGDLSLTAEIAPAGTNQLEVESGAQIIDAHAGLDFTVARLALIANIGIGLLGPNFELDTNVVNLEARTMVGGISIVQFGGDLVVGGVNAALNGVSAMEGDIKIDTNLSSLTLSEGVSRTGGIGNIQLLSANDLNVNAPVSVNDLGSITLQADSDFSGFGVLTSAAAGEIKSTSGIITISGVAVTLGAAVSTTGGGSISVTSTGAGLDINAPVSTAGAGGNGGITLVAMTNLDVNANVSILEATSTGSLVMTSGFDLTTGNTAQLSTQNGGIAVTARNVTLGAGSSVGVHGGSNITFSAGLSSFTTFTNQGQIFSDDGNVTVRFDSQDLQAGSSIIVAPNREVNLRANTGGVPAVLGSAGLGFDFTSVELNTITGGQLKITSAADIALVQSIALPNVQTLVLQAGGGIIDATPTEQADLTVTNLAVSVSTGIGNSDDINVAVTNLAFRNIDSGGVNITNSRALTIGSVFDVSTSTNMASGSPTTLIAPGAITVAVNTTSTGTLILAAGETNDAPTFADALTVKSGVTVTSTSGDVIFLAGDDISLEIGSAVRSFPGSVTITAGGSDLDNRGAITGAGNIMAATTLNLAAIDDITIGSLDATTAMLTSTNGAILDGNDATVNITATTLGLQAKTGIGQGPGLGLETQVSRLEAGTLTGGIFLTNGVTSPVTLHIGNVSGGIDGVRVATAGDIELINSGSILVNTTGDTVRTFNGHLLLSALGSDADVENSANVSGGIGTTSGDAIIQAGRDILLGRATGYGDVTATLGLSLQAGRDVILNATSYVKVTGPGPLTVNANRDISVFATLNGGAVFNTEGGTLTLNTGTGGTLVLDGDSGDPTVQSTSGDILIQADRFLLTANDSISTTGNVTIAPFATGRLIDLGSSTDAAANTLEISDAELDLITAGVIRLGSAVAGNLRLSAALTPAHTDTLTLISGADITQAASASLQVAKLALQGDTVLLENSANNFATLAGSATTSFTVKSSSGLTIRTVDALTGINAFGASVSLISTTGAIAIEAPLAAGGDLTLDGVGLTQTVTAVILQNAGGGSVTLSGGSGTIVLNQAINDFKSPVLLSSTAAIALLDGNDLALDGFSIAQSLILTAFGDVTQTGAFTGAGTLTFNGPGTLTLSATNTYTGATEIVAGILRGSGSIAGPIQIDPTVQVAPGVAGPGLIGLGSLTFTTGSTFAVDLNGTTAGTEYDSLAVTGGVDLRDATFSFTLGFIPAADDSFTLIENDGADAVLGTFADLPDGSVIASGGNFYRLLYNGGDGNDVTLTRLTLVPVTLAKNQKSATFTDADGDLVTVKTSRGKFDQADFVVVAAGQGGELALLNLSDDSGEFAGANITISAKKVKGGTGNGLTDVGYINSTGSALGALSIKGDLGQVDAGAGDPLKVALKSLKVQSLGVRGPFTQLDPDSYSSDIAGKLGAVTINANLAGASIVASASIGAVTIKGSFLGGSLRAGTTLGAVKITGDLDGTSDAPVIISAYGKAIAPTKGVDLAIASLTVGGSVDHLRLLAGYDPAGQGLNADASIGAILVKTNWSASTVLAGVSAGIDTLEGTTDDDKLSGTGVRDHNAAKPIYSSIASVLIKGTATGTPAGGDSFGIIAEQIGKAQIGTTKLAFTKGPRGATDFFPITGTTDFAIGEAS